MDDQKTTFMQGVYEGIVLVISGMGLTLDPAAFIGCMAFAATGSAVAKGLDPILSSRRGFWLTLATSLLFTVAMLILNDMPRTEDSWIPELSPQFVAICSGVFGPLAIPFLLRSFPKLADRLLGRIIPDADSDGG